MRLYVLKPHQVGIVRVDFIEKAEGFARYGLAYVDMQAKTRNLQLLHLQ